MANFTQYKKLELPVSTEKYDVGVVNKNNRVIDSELHKLDLKNQSQDELLATKESLTSEILRATSVETELNNSIDSEINRATTTEENIINTLTGELDNYLSLTGGTLEANANPILTLKRIEGNFTGLNFENPSGHLFTIEGYSSDDGTGKQFNVFARDWNKSLLRINESSRVIYDYITKSEKKILVEGEALPSSGGTIASATQQMLNLRYTGEKGDAIIQLFPDNSITKRIALQSAFSTIENNTIFKVFVIEDGSTKQLLGLSGKQKIVFDPKTNSMKDIMVKGDSITPTVKETTFKIKSRDLTIVGVTESTETDIRDIIIKAYGGSNLNEGMRVGISPSNGMGYIQAQNFVIDCNLLTLEETRLLQTFTSIRFSRANNSDCPLLMPATQDFEAGLFFTNKDGRSHMTTKVKILSDSAKNFFQYDLPQAFKNDKDSGTNLKLESVEWLVATGIDIKNRG